MTHVAKLKVVPNNRQYEQTNYHPERYFMLMQLAELNTAICR